MKKICVVAGEASGDLHGANLIRALKSRGGVTVCGTGGPAMREVVDGGFLEIAGTNVVGFSAVIKRLPFFLKLLNDIRAHIAACKPDLIVFIDNPGMNMRLAKKLAPLGVPMVYYICPQIWGWKPERVHAMKKLFKKALVVFDFEQEIYRKNGMPVSWVGHPLMDAIGKPPMRVRDSKQVLLMPGSRVDEVKTLLPIFLKAAALLRETVPGVSFTLVKADTLDDAFYAPFLSGLWFAVGETRGDRYRAMSEAGLALVCSGTATLEAALLGLPMIVLYLSSTFSYLLARMFILVKYLALPNLLADKAVVPEILQYECEPAKIAAEADSLLGDPEKIGLMRWELEEVCKKVGGPGASDRAAEEILNLL